MKITKCLTLTIVFFLIGISYAIGAQFQFTPRTSAQGEYTDNVFLSADNKEDDYIVTVSAGFTAALLGKTDGIEVAYDPAYEFYDEFDTRLTNFTTSSTTMTAGPTMPACVPGAI
jgi:uncharacterized protein (PEP-CTERM system associated)